jgi:hypothetical protein
LKPESGKSAGYRAENIAVVLDAVIKDCVGSDRSRDGQCFVGNALLETK